MYATELKFGQEYGYGPVESYMWQKKNTLQGEN